VALPSAKKSRLGQRTAGHPNRKGLRMRTALVLAAIALIAALAVHSLVTVEMLVPANALTPEQRKNISALRLDAVRDAFMTRHAIRLVVSQQDGRVVVRRYETYDNVHFTRVFGLPP